MEFINLIADVQEMSNYLFQFIYFRTEGYTGYKTCYTSFCCSGYTGATCSQRKYPVYYYEKKFEDTNSISMVVFLSVNSDGHKCHQE